MADRPDVDQIAAAIHDLAESVRERTAFERAQRELMLELVDEAKAFLLARMGVSDKPTEQ